MTLQEILADSKTFTDDMELQLGDNKIKLSDLRGLTSRQQKDLSDKLQAAAERERQATEMATKATEIFNDLSAQKAAASAQPTVSDDGDDFDTNNWWTPVRKRFSERDKKLEEAIAKVDTISKAFEKAATMFATDRWTSQYDRIAPRLKKSKEYADWDMPKLRDYAAKNQLIDEFGFPSVEKAAAALTRTDELEEIKRQAREEGLKEGLTRSRLERLNRPSSASGAKPVKGKSSVEEFGLEGLGDDVMSDDELVEQITRAQQAFDPNSLQ